MVMVQTQGRGDDNAQEDDNKLKGNNHTFLL